MLDTYPTPTRTVTKCLVCGCSEIRTDEVQDRGWVLLAECPRCDHRWTARAEPLVTRVRAVPQPEMRPVRRVELPAREVAIASVREVAIAGAREAATAA